MVSNSRINLQVKQVNKLIWRLHIIIHFSQIIIKGLVLLAFDRFFDASRGILLLFSFCF